MITHRVYIIKENEVKHFILKHIKDLHTMSIYPLYSNCLLRELYCSCIYSPTKEHSLLTQINKHTNICTNK